MSFRLFTLATAIVLGTMGVSAQAVTINTIADIDTNALTFEVDNFDTAPGSITGTSNGIGFEVMANAIFIPFSNLTGSQTYNDIPGSYDDLHLGSDFTITFDTPVQAVLFALGNDNNTGDGPDFGLIPADSMDITLDGTKLQISDINGSLALLTFATPITTLTHTNDLQLDGYDVSFFAFEAVAPVPLPGALIFLASGLVSLGFAHRRKKKRS